MPATTILSTLGKSLDTKSIMVYFSDPLLTRFVDQMGWSGSAPRERRAHFLRYQKGISVFLTVSWW